LVDEFFSVQGLNQHWIAVFCMFAVYAGVDLLDGRVARLVHGRRENAVFYPGSAVDFARRWEREGTDWIHVVDLSAAMDENDNERFAADVAASVNIPVQVGGGVRSLAKAMRLIDLGVSRVVISSLYFASRNKGLELLDVLGSDRICVAVDFGEDGDVLIRGWKEKAPILVGEAVEQVLADGFRNVLATDVARDGTLTGINSQALEKVHAEHRKYVVVGGGVSSVSDVLKVREMGFAGVVVGKALYEGLVSLRAVKAVIHKNV